MIYWRNLDRNSTKRNSKATYQQHAINKRRKIHCYGHIKLLHPQRSQRLPIHAICNHSDAAYLVATVARSRLVEYMYSGNDTNNKQKINGPILIIAKIIKGVILSAAEVEIGALYMNTRQLLTLRVTCKKLGHPQPATPIQIDNNTANGIINGTFNQARSKAIDIRYD